jgi:hypothetical protein
MPINVSEAIDGETAQVVSFLRQVGGSYVNGIWVPPTSESFKSMCSVQQPTPQQLLVIPEGERNKDIRLFISKKPLRTTDDKAGTIGDIALYAGKRFRMMWEGDWNAYGHSTMLGAAENDPE